MLKKLNKKRYAANIITYFYDYLKSHLVAKEWNELQRAERENEKRVIGKL
jgi:hypothetical protein